jgi:hypothetical protein
LHTDSARHLLSLKVFRKFEAENVVRSNHTQKILDRAFKELSTDVFTFKIRSKITKIDFNERHDEEFKFEKTREVCSDRKERRAGELIRAN